MEMKIRFYEDNERITAGMTLRDVAEPENCNMALHACISQGSVLANRRKLASMLDFQPDAFVCPNQTHSSNFYRATQADQGRGELEAETAIPDTDAVYTFDPNVVLCCFTADCVPVMFYSKEAGLVGVIHSGWKGTVGEISRKVFRHLIETYPCNPLDFRVYLGKALSREKFEVGEDVYLQFKALGYADAFLSCNSGTGKYHIDNRQVVKKQCELAGIPAGQIVLDPDCTFLDPDCFSYRKDKESGRHMSFILRK